LLLLVLCLLRYRRLPVPGARQLLWLLLLASSGIFLFNLLYFSGLQRVTASRGSVIMALSPGMVAVGSSLFFRQKLSVRTGLGLLLALAGTAWVISAGRPRSLLTGAIGPGELCLAGSMLCWSVYSLAGKTIMQELKPLVAISYSCWLGTLGLAAGAFWEGGLAGWRGYSFELWLGVLYLGALGTVAAFLLYYQGIQRCGPTRAAAFINLVPVFAISLGVLLLGETLSPSLLAGAAAVIAGITLANRGRSG
jgi:drug/metabolite transporter (DMT)-like permease